VTTAIEPIAATLCVTMPSPVELMLLKKSWSRPRAVWFRNRSLSWSS
jgi:hypothetical protein